MYIYIFICIYICIYINAHVSLFIPDTTLNIYCITILYTGRKIRM